MVLEDIEDCAGLAHGGDFAARGAFEVYDEGGVFLPRGHHVHCPVQHEAEVVDLAIGHFGVLFRGVEVETWSGVVVVAEDDLFAGFVFGGDVVEGEGIRAVFSPPGQGVL